MNEKLDRLLVIKNTRDYYDDGDIDKEEYDSLYSEIEKLMEDGEKYQKLKKIIERVQDTLLQELFKDVLDSMKKTYLTFDKPTYLKSQYKKKMELLESILNPKESK